MAPITHAPRIAVMEEVAIAAMVRNFKATLPQTMTYVHDNDSRGRTTEARPA